MTEDRVRVRVRCKGAVQGVGFRPTVHRIATELGLTGWVINDPGGVTIEVEGAEGVARSFAKRLRHEHPPLARIDHMTVEVVPNTYETAFEVRESTRGQRAGALVPPDAALCGDCRAEMADPSDRRHRYVFTTCTNCGPRFSLVHSLPYDRPQTAMACFDLCAICEGEYTDPSDRRFHAEPVCCPSCGPRLWFQDRAGATTSSGEEAVKQARQALLDGAILAIKGLGGFQLACRADQSGPVSVLRDRKQRPTKPFAVMVRDTNEADGLVQLTGPDRELLASHRAPVVLAPRRRPSPIDGGVAPGIADLGVLLTTTPLHVELFSDPRIPPLVMTSANLSEEPICRSNREAVERLADIADGYLLHDRDVVRRVDDSVVRSTPGGPVLVRRARGWVPEPLPLPESAPEPLLAVGGHLQNTACVGVENQAFLSQHVGDLDSEPARLFLREVIGGLEDFLQVQPRLVVADSHPDYPSTWLAGELAEARSGRVVEIQHHLAHAAAVLTEHGAFPSLDEEVLAISLDGTGWGPDGTAWGGEWLRLRGNLTWERVAHLSPLSLVGGEAAVREPWRVAASALASIGMFDALDRLPMTRRVEAGRVKEIGRLAASGDWPRASGAGRLFEAAGALLALVMRNDWEGEAAVQLESLAESWDGDCDTWSLELDHERGLPTLPSPGLLGMAAECLLDGQPPARIAAAFHATFCHLAVELTRQLESRSGTVVALGGGCLVNRILRRSLHNGLSTAGFQPLLATAVPTGDGGLSYGQAALAAVGAARGVKPRMSVPGDR